MSRGRTSSTGESFAETVLRRFGYDTGDGFMRDRPEDYSEEELTFYWSDDEYKEFLEELKEYVRRRTPPAGQGTLSRPE